MQFYSEEAAGRYNYLIEPLINYFKTNDAEKQAYVDKRVERELFKINDTVYLNEDDFNAETFTAENMINDITPPDLNRFEKFVLINDRNQVTNTRYIKLKTTVNLRSLYLKFIVDNNGFTDIRNLYPQPIPVNGINTRPTIEFRDKFCDFYDQTLVDLGIQNITSNIDRDIEFRWDYPYLSHIHRSFAITKNENGNIITQKIVFTSLDIFDHSPDLEFEFLYGKYNNSLGILTNRRNEYSLHRFRIQDVLPNGQVLNESELYDSEELNRYGLNRNQQEQLDNLLFNQENVFSTLELNGDNVFRKIIPETHILYYSHMIFTLKQYKTIFDHCMPSNYLDNAKLFMCSDVHADLITFLAPMFIKGTISDVNIYFNETNNLYYLQIVFQNPQSLFCYVGDYVLKKNPLSEQHLSTQAQLNVFAHVYINNSLILLDDLLTQVMHEIMVFTFRKYHKHYIYLIGNHDNYLPAVLPYIPKVRFKIGTQATEIKNIVCSHSYVKINAHRYPMIEQEVVIDDALKYVVYLTNYQGLETLTSAYFDSFRTVCQVRSINDMVHYYTRMLYYTILERLMYQNTLVVYGHEQTLSVLNFMIKILEDIRHQEGSPYNYNISISQHYLRNYQVENSYYTFYEEGEALSGREGYIKHLSTGEYFRTLIDKDIEVKILSIIVGIVLNKLYDNMLEKNANTYDSKLLHKFYSSILTNQLDHIYIDRNFNQINQIDRLNIKIPNFRSSGNDLEQVNNSYYLRTHVIFPGPNTPWNYCMGCDLMNQSEFKTSEYVGTTALDSSIGSIYDFMQMTHETRILPDNPNLNVIYFDDLRFHIGLLGRYDMELGNGDKTSYLLQLISFCNTSRTDGLDLKYFGFCYRDDEGEIRVLTEKENQDLALEPIIKFWQTIESEYFISSKYVFTNLRYLSPTIEPNNIYSYHNNNNINFYNVFKYLKDNLNTFINLGFYPDYLFSSFETLDTQYNSKREDQKPLYCHQLLYRYANNDDFINLCNEIDRSGERKYFLDDIKSNSLLLVPEALNEFKTRFNNTRHDDSTGLNLNLQEAMIYDRETDAFENDLFKRTFAFYRSGQDIKDCSVVDVGPTMNRLFRYAGQLERKYPNGLNPRAEGLYDYKPDFKNFDDIQKFFGGVNNIDFNTLPSGFIDALYKLNQNRDYTAFKNNVKTIYGLYKYLLSCSSFADARCCTLLNLQSKENSYFAYGKTGLIFSTDDIASNSKIGGYYGNFINVISNMENFVFSAMTPLLNSIMTSIFTQYRHFMIEQLLNNMDVINNQEDFKTNIIQIYNQIRTQLKTLIYQLTKYFKFNVLLGLYESKNNIISKHSGANGIYSTNQNVPQHLSDIGIINLADGTCIYDTNSTDNNPNATHAYNRYVYFKTDNNLKERLIFSGQYTEQLNLILQSDENAFYGIDGIEEIANQLGLLTEITSINQIPRWSKYLLKMSTMDLDYYEENKYKRKQKFILYSLMILPTIENYVTNGNQTSDMTEDFKFMINAIYKLYEYNIEPSRLLRLMQYLRNYNCIGHTEFRIQFNNMEEIDNTIKKIIDVTSVGIKFSSEIKNIINEIPNYNNHYPLYKTVNHDLMSIITNADHFYLKSLRSVDSLFTEYYQFGTNPLFHRRLMVYNENVEKFGIDKNDRFYIPLLNPYNGIVTRNEDNRYRPYKYMNILYNSIYFISYYLIAADNTFKRKCNGREGLNRGEFESLMAIICKLLYGNKFEYNKGNENYLDYYTAEKLCDDLDVSKLFDNGVIINLNTKINLNNIKDELYRKNAEHYEELTRYNYIEEYETQLENQDHIYTNDMIMRNHSYLNKYDDIYKYEKTLKNIAVYCLNNDVFGTTIEELKYNGVLYNMQAINGAKASPYWNDKIYLHKYVGDKIALPSMEDYENIQILFNKFINHGLTQDVYDDFVNNRLGSELSAIITLIRAHYLIEQSYNKLNNLYFKNRHYLTYLRKIKDTDSVTSTIIARKHLKYLNNTVYNENIVARYGVEKMTINSRYILDANDSQRRVFGSNEVSGFTKIKEILSNINWRSYLLILLIIIVVIIIISVIIINIRKHNKNKHK